jgi:signal transduction histidine kinase
MQPTLHTPSRCVVDSSRTCENSLDNSPPQVRELLQANEELKVLNAKLSATQDKLMQSEKLASIGQLAAGVAHEINNPIGYIFSNFGTLEKYLDQLFQMLSAYEAAEALMAGTPQGQQLRQLRESIELDYLKEDIPNLMSESKEGITRVRKIVQDLKDFSRVGASQEWVWANLHRGIDSTLNIVNNEVKYRADVVREYGEIPDVQCLPSEINQVVMNLLINAAQAISSDRGTITIRTGVGTGAEAESVWFEVEDTGSGIPKENISRVFDPFFTTKPVGTGTGLGLSLSYGIVQKHQGHIDVRSEPGQGTCFRVTLPIHHTVAQDVS